MKIEREHRPQIVITLSDEDARKLAFIVGCDNTISEAIQEPRAYEFLRELYLSLENLGYSGTHWEVG